MTNLIVTLPGGIALIVALFLMIYRLSNVPGKMVAIIMVFVVIGTYVPISIFLWPGADVFAIHIALYLVTVYLLGIVTSQRDSRKLAGQKATGLHWAPASIVGFFVVLLVADSFFVMFATQGMDNDFVRWLLPSPSSGGKMTSHFPGTVSHDFHEKQQQYNEYLKRFDSQQLRNWQVRKGWIGNAISNKPSLFRVEIKNYEKQPVRSAIVNARFLRPANSKFDKLFVLEEIQPGVYQHSIVLTEPGNWDLILTIKKNEDQHEIRARTTIK